MRFLVEREDPDFADCDATIEFTERINNIFDMLNSRDDGCRSEFKLPLSSSNKDMILQYMDDCIDYLKKLHTAEGLVVNSTKKTGPKGLIINMVSVKMFYEDLIETAELCHLPVYLLNQDPLESFFSRIRAFNCLGSNDNPTTSQFCSAYRKNLVKNEITASAFANCKDELDILTVSSSTKASNSAANVDAHLDNGGQLANEESTHAQQCVLNMEQIENSCVIDSCENVTVAYFAVTIEEIIREKKLFPCSICENVLNENENISLESIPGKKFVPCKTTFYICKVTHDTFEPCMADMEFDYSRLFNCIIEKIEKNMSTIYPETNFQEHADHKSQLIKLVTKHCIRLRATHIARSITLQIHERNIRRKYTKEIQHRGQ